MNSMVIFHSYVALPEGTQFLAGPSACDANRCQSMAIDQSGQGIFVKSKMIL